MNPWVGLKSNTANSLSANLDRALDKAEEEKKRQLLKWS